MQQIPVPAQNDSLTEIDLEGDTYFIQISWNSEGEYWTLSLESANQDTLVDGIAMVPDWPLTSRFRKEGFPPGEFMVIVPDRRNVITYHALVSGDAAFVYFTRDEINAAI